MFITQHKGIKANKPSLTTVVRVHTLLLTKKKKKSRTFQEAWEPCVVNTTSESRVHSYLHCQMTQWQITRAVDIND